jgi:hypothetical protein
MPQNTGTIRQKEILLNTNDIRLLQKYLSSPSAFIGDMVFQAVTTGFPIRNASGMTVFGVCKRLNIFPVIPPVDV